MKHTHYIRVIFIILLGLFSSQSWAEKSCEFLEGTWKTHVNNGSIDKHNGRKWEYGLDEELQLQGQNYKDSWSITLGHSDSFDGSYTCNKLNEKDYVFTLQLPDGATITYYITLSNNGLNWSGYRKSSIGREIEVEYTRISALPQSTSTGSDNSNSSNTNQQSRTHKERVNLPEQSGCISMGESNKKDPTHNTRWFLLKNSCAYSVNVRWCAGNSCSNSEASTSISGGGTYETWAKKDSDGRVHLNLMACQLKSGNDEVFTDWPHKQCWANVEMQ